MKRTVISLIILILAISFVSSLAFTIDAPAEVEENTSFTVSISASTSDLYDVKIYVFDDTKEFSEIYDGSSWNSPYKYLTAVFPQTTSFQVKAHYIGDTNITVKLRKNGGTSANVVSQLIKVNPTSQSPSKSSSSQPPKTIQEEELSSVQQSSTSQSSINQIQQNPTSNYQEDKIRLSAKKSSSSEKQEYITSQGLSQVWLPYVFSFICVVIILFLIIKKL